MPTRKVHVTGSVVRELIDAGSKSERTAVVLETDAGEAFVLRQQGAPAFGDSGLDALVGHAIRASGVAVDHTLILHDWERAD